MKAPGGGRWLIISYFSRIDGMACAQHIDDRIPLLRDAGVSPVLLTGICGERWEGLAVVRSPSIAPSGIRFEVRHLFRKRGPRRPFIRMLEFLLLLPTFPFYLVEKLVIDLDSQWSWFPLAALRGRAICRKVRPALIYSTGGPPSAHIAAGIIARMTGIPWVAEVQDPLVHGDWNRGRPALKVFSFAERYVCARASRVVFLTEEARRRAAARTALGDRGRCIYPGAEPSPALPWSRRKDSPLRLAHFGSLGGSRNPAVLLAAVRRMLDERPELAKTLRLDFYGTCDTNSRRTIREFRWRDVVAFHGRMSRAAARDAMGKTDVLLLVQNVADYAAETIPSKVYEYLMTGRPILGLVHRNPELAGMLTAAGHTVAEAADVESVRTALEAICRRWENGTLEATAKSPYTTRAAVAQLIPICREAILEAARDGERSDG